MLLSFLLLSPEVIRDIRYIHKVVERELSSYLFEGNQTEIGGWVNHLFSIAAYWLFYSDLPLSPILCVIGIRCIQQSENTDMPNADTIFLFRCVLPSIALGFLVYNSFVKTLFMRTLYPFFVIVLLYAANGLSVLFSENNTRKVMIPIFLTGILVLRGSLYIAAMLPSTAQQHLSDCIEQASEISGGKRIVGLALDTYYTGKGGEPVCEPYIAAAEDHSLSELKEADFPEIHSGDVIITVSLEFGKAQAYPFPIDDEAVKRFINGWKNFKSTYSPYYVGQSYPQIYGYLFGFWIKGTTVGDYDFPMNYVYGVP